jgi:hypothetical protein
LLDKPAARDLLAKVMVDSGFVPEGAESQNDLRHAEYVSEAFELEPISQPLLVFLK